MIVGDLFFTVTLPLLLIAWRLGDIAIELKKR